MFCFRKLLCWVWWCMPVILTVRQLSRVINGEQWRPCSESRLEMDRDTNIVWFMQRQAGWHGQEVMATQKLLFILWIVCFDNEQPREISDRTPVTVNARTKGKGHKSPNKQTIRKLWITTCTATDIRSLLPISKTLCMCVCGGGHTCVSLHMWYVWEFVEVRG